MLEQLKTTVLINRMLFLSQLREKVNGSLQYKVQKH